MYYNSFRFFRYEYNDAHHYTDQRNGSPMYYLAMMLRGSCRIVSRERTITAQPGEVFFIPRGLPYQSYWYGPEISFLSFGFLSLSISRELNAELQILECTEEERAAIRAIPTEGQDVSCAALAAFYGVMDRLLDRLQPHVPSRKCETVARAKAYVATHTAATMRQVAHHCGVSEPYLYAAFRAAEGLTPNEFRQRVLCQRAAELLTATDLSVEAISEQLGFSSASYFRKVLKKHLSLSPSQIRRAGNM